MNLKPILDSEFEALFLTVKQGIYSYVDSVFGWDDNFQRDRLKNDYEPSGFIGLSLMMNAWVYSASNLMTTHTMFIY